MYFLGTYGVKQGAYSWYDMDVFYIKAPVRLTSHYLAYKTVHVPSIFENHIIGACREVG